MSRFECLYLISQYLLLLVTGVYAAISLRQLFAIRDQANIANRTLLLTQHPKLRIRNVAIDNLPDSINRKRLNNVALKIKCTVVNIGGAEASITKSHCDVFWTTEQLPMQPPYEDNTPINNRIRNENLQPGESLFISFDSNNLTMQYVPIHEYENFQTVRIMGFINYTDKVNVPRRTAFCRRLVSENGRYYLIPEKDPNYEYED